MSSLIGFRRLRTRVTFVAFAVSLVAMTIAAVAMYRYQEQQLLAAVDANLEETVTNVLNEFNIAYGDTDVGSDDGSEKFLRSIPSSDRSLQLVASDGTVLAASGLLAGQPALVDPSHVEMNMDAVVDKADTMDGDGDAFRIAVSVIKDDRVLVAAYSLKDMAMMLDGQRTASLFGVPILAFFVGLLTWLALGSALKPVEAMREEVANISGNALERRVPVPARSAELAALATTMNEMLDRLDASSRAQKRFVADAAHELRSPLAGIRGQLEVNMLHPNAPGRAESEREILDETIRLQNLVDGLLSLAQTSGEAQRAVGAPRRVELDLDDLVFDQAASLRRATGLKVDVEAVSAAQIVGDPDQLRRVLRNLADNAGRHATSRVAFELHEDADTVHLAITDDGPGVPAADAETIFNRFTRLDEARGRDSGGSGLGLAICREIVQSHGGSLKLDQRYTRGARFVVSLPLAPMSPAPTSPTPTRRSADTPVGVGQS